MKIFLLLFLFLPAFHVQANDTLTRAQVYNFNVGDTFDYKIETAGQDATIPDTVIIYPDRISYLRIVISSLQNFSVQDSVSLIEEIYGTPNPSSAGDTFSFKRLDTLFVDSSSKYAVLDAKNFCQASLCSIIMDTAYNLRLLNRAILCGGLGCAADSSCYADGLGKTLRHLRGGDGQGSWFSTDTSLVYYSKAGETWGTPATIAVGIPNITTPQPSITLFPTVNSGQFKIKIINGISAEYQLVVYDLLGREIDRTVLNNNLTNIEIPHPSAGMYIWNVTKQGSVLQSGKMVIH